MKPGGAFLVSFYFLNFWPQNSVAQEGKRFWFNNKKKKSSPDGCSSFLPPWFQHY